MFFVEVGAKLIDFYFIANNLTNSNTGSDGCFEAVRWTNSKLTSPKKNY
jgi:hypothetical protein